MMASTATTTTTRTTTTAPLGPGWKSAGDKRTGHEEGERLGTGTTGASAPGILRLSALRCWQHIKTLKPAARPSRAAAGSAPYSVAEGAQEALGRLCRACADEFPQAVFPLARNVEFGSSSGKGHGVHFPTPLKEQDAAAAIKALEACAAAAVADLRFGTEDRRIRVDLDRVSTFLMSAYVTTLDGMDKADPRIRARLPDTDLNRAQSVLYRRLSANLYRTKNPGEYYHIHGSLDADATLSMLGLPRESPGLTDYRDIIDYIGSAVQRHTAAELDALNVRHRQAGVQALTWDQFRRTPHGRALTQLPPLTVRANPHDAAVTPPVPFDPLPSAPSGHDEGNDGAAPPTPRRALQGVRVLELCRIIAGPTIGRSLAAHGAQVLKVTSGALPDVPFFQLDVNTGKRAVQLDLRRAGDRAAFEGLLAQADVLVDGYRPGALARLGYSARALAEVARRRGRGFVYVAEDCFGQPFGNAGATPDQNKNDSDGSSRNRSATDWSTRPGWQQIADCVTGAAWAQGQFMGLAEPVVPPFPMSDYGTGALGAAAAIAGLYRRATRGGSWVCRTSLCQYDAFVLGLGLLPEGEQERLRREFGGGGDDDFFALRHNDSVDEVGRRALAAMRRVVPHLFDEQKMMHAAWSEGFQGVVRWPREAVQVDGLKIGHVRTARPNGFDELAAGWEEWEEDKIDDVVGELGNLSL